MKHLTAAARAFWHNPEVRAVTINGRRYDRADMEDAFSLLLCVVAVAAVLIGLS